MVSSRRTGVSSSRRLVVSSSRRIRQTPKRWSTKDREHGSLFNSFVVVAAAAAQCCCRCRRCRCRRCLILPLSSDSFFLRDYSQ